VLPFTNNIWLKIKYFSSQNFWLYSICAIALSQRTKIGPQKGLGIYIGYESPSFIRYLEPKIGEVFTARFDDCHFNKVIFPALRGEKKC